MIPDEAVKPENEFDVKTNLEINARRKRKNPVLEVGDVVRSFRKRKVGEKERVGDYEPGTKKVTEITKSLGQTFYKLDNEDKPYVRADIALLRKGTTMDSMRHVRDFDPEEEETEGKVPKHVNDARNIKIGDDERDTELPAGDSIAKIVERVSKMNKKDLAKHLAKSKGKEPPTRSKAEPPRHQVGGSSGSGIPRDPNTGRAL